MTKATWSSLGRLLMMLAIVIGVVAAQYAPNVAVSAWVGFVGGVVGAVGLVLPSLVSDFQNLTRSNPSRDEPDERIDG